LTIILVIGIGILSLFYYMITPVDKSNNKDIRIEVIEVAKNAMEATKDIVATKGRASYLGERSVGHIDPGAMSSYLMIKVVCENL